MKCKSCKEEFEPMYRNGLLISKLCIPCVLLKSNAKRKQLWRSEKKELKTALKTHSEWLNDLQKVFNTYIRERDKGKPCISCDAKIKNNGNASHFFSVGAYPNIRFNEDNCHQSCIYCNKHLHGNINEYAIRLPYRIGHERYDKLLIDRKPSNKLTTAEIKEKITLYKHKTTMLQVKRVDLFEQNDSDEISNLF